MSKLLKLLDFLVQQNGINDKAKLTSLTASHFGLIKDRSVFYCDSFAIRFSSASTSRFSNTVLSLSNLKKFDHIPFVVCVVTPNENYAFIANSTFLKKISHSSQELREDNIKGSFNGTDIIRNFEGISNEANNIARLFAIHQEIGFEGNLTRLVESTNNISPTGQKYAIDHPGQLNILNAPERALEFVDSKDYEVLKKELDQRVEKYTNEILVASMIENVNIRGRIIEYLIAGESELLRSQLISALQSRETKDALPAFKTENTLGDYQRIFDKFHTETDVKTKIMILSSNPKAYNLDKILEFLSSSNSVFCSTLLESIRQESSTLF
jgi:hypothetical protein